MVAGLDLKCSLLSLMNKKLTLVLIQYSTRNSMENYLGLGLTDGTVFQKNYWNILT